jgi:hypothetical protein
MRSSSHDAVARALRCLTLAAAPSLAGAACTDDAPGAADPAREARSVISTHYLGAGTLHRRICVVDPPQAVYAAAIVARRRSGECEHRTALLGPVPPERTTSELCARLGLAFKIFDDGVGGCVAAPTAALPVSVYCHEFASSDPDIDYRVIDAGDGLVFGSSGWQGGNGCPRDGAS